MTGVIRATSISSGLSDLLTGTARGAVVALFERSAYLDLDGRIVALGSAEFGRGPLMIGLDRFDALRPLAVGAAVGLHEARLRVGLHEISLRDAVVWDPALPQAGGRGGAEPARPDLVIEELRRIAPAESIAALLDGPPDPAAPADALLDPLRQGLEGIARFLSGRADAASAAGLVATHVAGRGPGLTPSGDDLLTGIMHAITVWPRIAAHAGAPDVRRLFADAARPKTTRISAAYLDAAARGQAGEPWHALVRSLGQSHATARRAARRVLAVGETSGADALTGFCWAWRRLFP